MMFFRDASIWRLKPLLGKGSSANSPPIGLIRISWKQGSLPASFFEDSPPIGLIRISWKPQKFVSGVIPF